MDTQMMIPYYYHLFVAAALLFLLHFFSSKSHSVYLLDFSCYLPPPHLRAAISKFLEHFELLNKLDDSKGHIDFLTKVAQRTGVGPEACIPDALHQLPPTKSLDLARDETETVAFTVVKDLIAKHGINPKNIDIIVTNCSVFCHTPSMSAMIMNKFGFRSNVKNVSLTGMGCSAGLVAINLAKDLLRVHRNSVALVVSMEAMTPSCYMGYSKSMLLPNVLFRMGGVAVLLSNKKQDKMRGKYRLKHILRTHMGSDDESYRSVFQKNDDSGAAGVSLTKSLLHVARNALKTNITELGPCVLPLSEQLRYGLSFLRAKIGGKGKIYIPNFKKAFEHFCIHAGGKAVIDAVEESLRLTKEDTEASRMTLYRFGNTSSSSVWYELCYLEAKGKMKKGERVWQIALGSGFKCNSAVWECLQDIDPTTPTVWSDDIHLYPVQVPDVADYI